MKSIFAFVLFTLLFLLPSQWAMAANAPAAAPRVSKTILYDSKGNSFKVNLIQYTNHHQNLEVRIEAAGVPRFASKINPLLGFGRDLDGNNKIDTWFLLSKNGIDLIRREGLDPNGADILGKLLISKYRSTFSMHATSFATSLLSYLFISANEGINVQEDYYRDWMDLEEARINFEDDLKTLGSSYNYTQIQYHYELFSFGYKDLADRMDRFVKKSFWGYAFADIGLWITGGVVLNWSAKFLTKAGIIASESAFITAVKDTVVGFFEKQRSLIESRITSLKDKMHITKNEVGMKTAKVQLTAALTAATWKIVLTRTIKSQKLKQKLRIYIKKSLVWPKNILNGAKSEWKYIALNTGVQLGSEAVARYEDIYDQDPAVMAKNLLTNPEVIQNVGFMTTDTILMTGLSKNLKTTKARFMASGAVALTNSTVTNLALKDEPDLTRVAIDTAWEAVIGNAQVQLDLKVLETFEKMALKKNNPKVKLVGYAIVLVDMAVGYVAYSKLSSAIEEPKVMLVPVLAEN